MKCIAEIDAYDPAKNGPGNGRDLQQVRLMLDDSHHYGWEDRLQFEVYLGECKNGTLFAGYKKREDPAELRAKALGEWDNVIRNDIDQRRKALKKASTKVVSDSAGSTRVDTYFLKKGGAINCTTKVSDSGTFMNCDGEP